LADVAHLEKQIQFYNGLAGNKVRESEKVVAGRLDKIRNDKSESSRRSIYGYSDTVDTSVLLKEDLDGFRKSVAKAKKAKQKLQDEILELNVQTVIQLSDKAVTMLQAEGLL
jgi:galactokinase/mevalonate kinase-like predicted kinase